IGQSVLDQFSVSIPNIKRYSAYAYYSRIRLGQDTSQNVNLIVMADRGRYGRFGLHDQVQIGNMHRYGMDWSLQSPTRDAFIRAGIDRLTNATSNADFAPSFGIRLPLPGGQSLLLTLTG